MFHIWDYFIKCEEKTAEIFQVRPTSASGKPAEYLNIKFFSPSFDDRSRSVISRKDLENPAIAVRLILTPARDADLYKKSVIEKARKEAEKKGLTLI